MKAHPPKATKMLVMLLIEALATQRSLAWFEASITYQSCYTLYSATWPENYNTCFCYLIQSDRTQQEHMLDTTPHYPAVFLLIFNMVYLLRSDICKSDLRQQFICLTTHNFRDVAWASQYIQYILFSFLMQTDYALKTPHIQCCVTLLHFIDTNPQSGNYIFSCCALT